MEKRIIPKEVFSIYLDNNYSNEINFNKPYVFKDFIVATDKSNMIRVPIGSLENQSSFNKSDFNFTAYYEHKMIECDIKIRVDYLKDVIKRKSYFEVLVLCGIPFQVQSLIKLIKTCTALNEEFVLWKKYGEEKTIPSLFKVNIVEILIMPFSLGQSEIFEFNQLKNQ